MFDDCYTSTQIVSNRVNVMQLQSIADLSLKRHVSNISRRQTSSYFMPPVNFLLSLSKQFNRIK